MLVSSIGFLKQFLTSPKSIGAIAPSSRGLARSMTDWIDWPRVRNAVEVGPGTGAFTRTILRRMNDDAHFFMIELNGSFARKLTRQFPGITVYLDSVENLADCCDREGIARVDAVLCGLPWASFSPDLQDRCLDAITRSLRPGGQFVTFAYLHGLVLPSAKRFRAKLGEHFASIERSPVRWMNLPPAFVYRCRTAACDVARPGVQSPREPLESAA